MKCLIDADEMQFRMTPDTYRGEEHAFLFTEETAPKWLKEGGTRGSTMDNRWFWEEHVMLMKVGDKIATDCHSIERVR